MSALLSVSVTNSVQGKIGGVGLGSAQNAFPAPPPNKEKKPMPKKESCSICLTILYDKHCGKTDGSGYTYICDMHRREDDKLQASKEARRHDAHIELLHRIDDPNDYFNEDDLERITSL